MKCGYKEAFSKAGNLEKKNASSKLEFSDFKQSQRRSQY